MSRLCRLVPLLIIPTGAEPGPARGGTTVDGGRSDSGQGAGGGGVSSAGYRDAPPTDTTDEEEEEEEEGEEEVVLERDRDRRLRCCWNSCLSPWPRTPMLSLAFSVTLERAWWPEGEEPLLEPEAPPSGSLSLPCCMQACSTGTPREGLRQGGSGWHSRR